MGYCFTFIVTECTPWDLYVWNLPDCDLFDERSEICPLSSSDLKGYKRFGTFSAGFTHCLWWETLRRKRPPWMNSSSRSFFFSSFSLKWAPQFALSGTRVNTFCPWIRRRLFTITAIILTTRFIQRWISFWIALLFSLWPVGSVHFIVSGLLPFIRGGFYITAFSMRSPMQDFLNYTLRNVRHMKYLQDFVQVTLLVCDRGIERTISGLRDLIMSDILG